MKRLLLALLALTFAGGAHALSRSTVLQATSSSSHGTGAYTTGAYTPSNNSLQLACVYASGENNDALAASDIKISTSGVTWTSQAATTTHTGYGYGVSAYTAPISTGASMTIQVDAGAFNVHRWRVEVYEYTGYNTGSPVGATAIGSDADGDVAAALTLSANPAADSDVMACLLVALTSGAGGVTPNAAWSEIFELSETAWQVMQSQARTGSTSTSVDWDDINSGGGGTGVGAAFLAVEIKNASGGGGSTLQIKRRRH